MAVYAHLEYFYADLLLLVFFRSFGGLEVSVLASGT